MTQVHEASPAARPERTIDYFVNGEVQHTQEHKLTVRQILENAGFTPVESYLLTRDNGHQEYSDYDQEVPIHQDERFTATFKGPTPTS